MSNYDTPHTTLDRHLGVDHLNLNEPAQNNSMEFAIGTQFDMAASGPPVNTPSYNNPLASVAAVENLTSYYDSPRRTGIVNIVCILYCRVCRLVVEK